MEGPLTRRDALRTAWGTLAGGTLASGMADVGRAQTAGEGWPQFGYDGANTGHAPNNTGLDAPVELNWYFGTTDPVSVTPAVGNGMVYLAGGDTVFGVGIESGDYEWRFPTDGRISSSPAVANGLVYVGSEDGNVYALDATSGTERWNFATAWGTVYSTPTVVDDTVYVGSVYALDAANGTERWHLRTDSPVGSAPAVAGGTVYVTSRGISAVDADAGTERWRIQNEGMNAAPAASADTVYVGSEDGTVYALASGDGSERWTVTADGAVSASPVVANGIVYVGSESGTVYALDTESGDERWRSEADRTVTLAPAVVDGAVHVGSESGTVYALDAESGDERWQFEIGSQLRSSPVVAGGSLYVGSRDSRLYALTERTATSTPTRTSTRTTEPSESVVDDGTGGDGDGDTDTGDDPSLPFLPVAGAAAAGAGGLWYWRHSGDDPDPNRTSDDPPGPDRSDDGSGGPERWETPRQGGATASGTDDGEDDPEPTATERIDDALDRGDGHREAAADHAEAGEYDRALSALDDAQEAYREARDAAAESDAIDTEGIEERLAGLDDRRRSVRHERVASRHEALAADLDLAERLVDTDPEAARDRLTDLEGRIADLVDRADEEGFEDLADRTATLESERTDLLTAAERAGQEAPPESIPRAPDVSVDYGALTDEEPIGGGGNADVTKATLSTPTGNVTLAIKRPRMSGTLHTDAVERLLDEAETWDKLDDHDHVVGVVDYDASPVPWIAMEYMDAGDLGERAGELDFDQALWTAIAITKGVRHAHRKGVAHLDLKPANVLLRSVEGAWDVPKVADWGLSKHLLDHSASVEGLSPQYAAPEQFDDEFGPVDEITDVYQLGAVLYELFTGRPPFEGKPAKAMHRVLHEDPTPPSEVADVPETLDDVLLTALEKEKRARYESVLYLRDALRDLRD